VRLRGLKKVREQSGYTQIAAANAMGLPIDTYRGYEQLKSSPRSNELSTLADFFKCTTDALYGRDLPPGAINASAVESAIMIAYGRVAAGIPIEMCEVIEEIEVAASLKEKHPYAYFLVVSGDSMNEKVPDGHYAMIDPEAEVNNGDIAAVNVNGYDATLKVWHKTNNNVILSPKSTNQEHEDIIINENDPDAPNLRILGKYIMSMSPYEG
jgi:repressor LexA